MAASTLLVLLFVAVPVGIGATVINCTAVVLHSSVLVVWTVVKAGHRRHCSVRSQQNGGTTPEGDRNNLAESLYHGTNPGICFVNNTASCD
jgi:hypothetical protein